MLEASGEGINDTLHRRLARGSFWCGINVQQGQTVYRTAVMTNAHGGM